MSWWRRNCETANWKLKHSRFNLQVWQFRWWYVIWWFYFLGWGKGGLGWYYHKRIGWYQSHFTRYKFLKKLFLLRNLCNLLHLFYSHLWTKLCLSYYRFSHFFPCRNINYCHYLVSYYQICSRIFSAKKGDERFEKLFIKKDSSSADSLCQLFVDTAVYSRNRCFRLALSSKAGKNSMLLPTGRYKAKGMVWYFSWQSLSYFVRPMLVVQMLFKNKYYDANFLWAFYIMHMNDTCFEFANLLSAKWF